MAIEITKPNPNWKVIEKDLKALKQLFHVRPEQVGFWFRGYAYEPKAKQDAIFLMSGTYCDAWKYTERGTSKVMFHATDIDGSPCWIVPDENYNFEITYMIKG